MSLLKSMCWFTFTEYTQNYIKFRLSGGYWIPPKLSVPLDLNDDYSALVVFGTGDGLVLSGNKPLPEAMLIKFYQARMS